MLPEPAIHVLYGKATAHFRWACNKIISKVRQPIKGSMSRPRRQVPTQLVWLCNCEKRFW